MIISVLLICGIKISKVVLKYFVYFLYVLNYIICCIISVRYIVVIFSDYKYSLCLRNFCKV